MTSFACIACSQAGTLKQVQTGKYSQSTAVEHMQSSSVIHSNCGQATAMQQPYSDFACRAVAVTQARVSVSAVS